MRHTGTRHRLPPPRACRACCALLVAVGASATGGPVTHGPTGGSAVVKVADPSRTAAPASPGARRVVFTCIETGLIIFADRPCGPGSQVRDMQVAGVRPAVTTAAAAATSTARPRPAGAGPAGDPRDQRDEDEAQAAHAGTCDRLQRALQELDARMRAGYSAREAGRLWSRWREAKDRLREAAC